MLVGSVPVDLESLVAESGLELGALNSVVMEGPACCDGDADLFSCGGGSCWSKIPE